IRIAAPVGQARTQAAPPLISLHISHFTAFLMASPSDFFAALFFACPGAGPAPNISHDSRPEVLSLVSAIWITPYGQFCWQLPQPMQLSAINTSPSGAR